MLKGVGFERFLGVVEPAMEPTDLVEVLGEVDARLVGLPELLGGADIGDSPRSA